jgi:hypothetical protein
MPIDPSALLNLWSLEELPACEEDMEHARAFLSSAGEAVSSIENHDPRLLLREFVILFRIFAAHSATCTKCNQVSVADSNVAMPRMTAELFREILDSLSREISKPLRSKKQCAKAKMFPPKLSALPSSGSRAR